MTREEQVEQVWRVGRKIGRTIYAQVGFEPSDDDQLIGVMDTPELAKAAVRAHNAEGESRRAAKATREIVYTLGDAEGQDLLVEEPIEFGPPWDERKPSPIYWPELADREEVGPIGDGTPHARMQWFWERMLRHARLIGELTDWNIFSSTYRFEAAIGDAFDRLAESYEAALAATREWDRWRDYCEQYAMGDWRGVAPFADAMGRLRAALESKS